MLKEQADRSEEVNLDRIVIVMYVLDGFLLVSKKPTKTQRWASKVSNHNTKPPNIIGNDCRNTLSSSIFLAKQTNFA